MKQTKMQRLKDLRLQKKMSQVEVASYIGKTVQAYSLYETGKAKPPLDTIGKLAALFNTSIDYLVDAQYDCKDSPVEHIVKSRKYNGRYKKFINPGLRYKTNE